MSFSSLYAKYYDRMYATKNYRAEVMCVLSLFKKFGRGPIKKILSLGAGTLNHERILAHRGMEVYGIDLSISMVACARRKIKEERLTGITIARGDMRTFAPPAHDFDAVIAMFNVIGYGREKDLARTLAAAYKALRPGGLFFFDGWYGPAVRKDPPYKRWIKVKKEDCTLYRLANPDTHDKTQTIKIGFELFEFCGKRLTSRAHETHVLHYWDTKELKDIFKRSGFTWLAGCAFPDAHAPLSDKNWNMGVVARRK